MGGAVHGDLGEVRDAQDLVAAGDAAEFFADGVGGLASDVGIDLVKHQNRYPVMVSQHGLNRQHDARDFSTGGNSA